MFELHEKPSNIRKHGKFRVRDVGMLVRINYSSMVCFDFGEIHIPDALYLVRVSCRL